ncbi:MAG: phosphoribosylaminoimidazolesuccinocarboxamide synthase [Verrucomicrobia bacterium Tous-C9LFEB]|nr:MAG: phosphoribosylaminoimidazolesuccinocarboxamide synthase [Verrucomicrobia bacterium Tous-C9LFEB]
MAGTDFSKLPLKKLRSGKVRDLYEYHDEMWLVASDRISAFDVILPTPIPDKGVILTQLSRHWFELTKSICPNHIISYDVPAELTIPEWKGRLMRARKLEIIPFECVARGYLAGSGLKEYKEKGTVCGHVVPAGLQESSQLPQPIFTPATKAEAGHDMNLTPAEAREQMGEDLYKRLDKLTLDLYTFAAQYARERGIIIADTKFEFGWFDGQIVLADEALTPDSSRFWPAARWQPGKSQPSFDKQFVRDYLEGLDWNKQAPGPELPPQIVERTRAKYEEALKRLSA